MIYFFFMVLLRFLRQNVRLVPAATLQPLTLAQRLGFLTLFPRHRDLSGILLYIISLEIIHTHIIMDWLCLCKRKGLPIPILQNSSKN